MSQKLSRRKFLQLATMAAAGSFLAACGGQPADDTGGEDKPTEEMPAEQEEVEEAERGIEWIERQRT